MEKKVYVKPELTVHGDIEKITLNGNLVNADTPSGPNNTAFCPGGMCVTQSQQREVSTSLDNLNCSHRAKDMPCYLLKKELKFT